MTLRWVIEGDRLIYKSDDTNWQKEATVAEYEAFISGVEKGHELVAKKVKEKIMELTIECYPEHPLSHPPIKVQPAPSSKQQEGR